MKISKITSILALASLLIVTLLTGCTTKKDDKSSTSEVSKASIITNWAVENNDENKIYFSYPIFEGDTEHSVKMNELILEFVKSTLQHSRFRDFNGSFNNLTKGVEQENDHYTDLSADIEYEVLRNDSEYFSVKFEGLCIYKGAAYPTNYFTSLIIDVENYELVALSDLYNVDVKFTEFVQKKIKDNIRTSLSEKFGLSPDEIPDSVEEQSHLEDNTYHLKILQQMDKNNDYNFHSFMTEDEMGFSVPLVHALGDHIEIMISYDELAQFLKTYYTEIETTEISDITFSEETTEDDEIINSSFKYIPFSNS
ncbi:MAG TPA: hypothetical protein GX710_04465, partial [Clostridiales bacterium]|nr:hypothetical protein [Clostridiales bacterium]